jgi:PAS domain S-box-containing protein
MKLSGKWRTLLLFFLPAVAIAALVGAVNLHAFYTLQFDHHQGDADRIRMLQEAATLTDFNQRLSRVQLQMEELLTLQLAGSLSAGELERASRELGVRLTALDWEFGNRFTSSGVTAEIHSALDAAEAHRLIMLEALQAGSADPEQARTYLQAATEKQKLLIQASNTIIERVVQDQLAAWQQHNDEFKAHSFNTILLGGLTILLLLVLWLGLIAWLGRDLLQLTTVLQKLAKQTPELDGMEAIEKIEAHPANLMRPLATTVLTFRDTIQARQQAEQELRKLSLVVEQDPNGVVVTDLDARIEYVNDAFVAMTGYERDWILGRNPRLLRSGKTPQSTYQSMWDSLLRGENWQGEFINRRRDGSELIEHAIIMPLRQPTGEISHYVAIKRDVTKRKRMEADLERYQSHLEQLVSERTRDLNRAKVSAEIANRSKSEFLANITHELLTPMNAIIGLSGLAKASAQEPKQQKQLAQVETSARQLLDIINNLLDLSQLESNQLQAEQQELSLQQLVEQVQAEVQAEVEQRGLSISTELGELPQQVWGDPRRLQQVLRNLTRNAVKFTEQGEIRLAVHPVAQDAQQIRVRFSVTDTGIGISPAQLQRLFQPFEQADNSTTRHYGGSGVGLAISKRIIDLLQGELGVDSREGVGSTFWFEVPLQLHLATSRSTEDTRT